MDARLAVDGDPRTAWTTRGAQKVDDFYRIRFARPARVARISLAVRFPLHQSYEFPMHVEVLGKERGDDWDVLPLDEAAAYERLFSFLLHRPGDARLDLDVPPRLLKAVKVRITATDPFWMTWTLPEIRVYERR